MKTNFFTPSEALRLLTPSFCGSPRAWEELYMCEPFKEASSVVPLSGYTHWFQMPYGISQDIRDQLLQ
jgi:hypothetical protein